MKNIPLYMLNGKIALITGASRGIGRGIALTFAKNGAFICLNYKKNDNEAKETLKQILDLGGDGILLKADVSKQIDVDNMVKTILEKKEKIDILVNNAGIYIRNKFNNLSIENWEKIILNNLTSGFLLCKNVIPHMSSNSKIIFISSQLALKGSSHGSDYASSKAGILGLMKSLALELANKKICVNAVAPGTIDTDIISNYTEKMRKDRIKSIPLGRLGTSEDVANCCLFLASNLSDYITGETINVNGGLYIC
jgi:3-oxoacyl-[acyl-carrier protein] reductase